ncbi:hypothetical protein EFO75_10290 [Limosilactobacillus reuteri]|nr:hypothetical protein [Limosilactobacillus reuteri]MCT3217935.1 hypothetical protein [Limosilactobacillus reuteri]
MNYSLLINAKTMVWERTLVVKWDHNLENSIGNDMTVIGDKTTVNNSKLQLLIILKFINLMGSKYC